MSDWQPISSAPRDGSTVLLYSAKARYRCFAGIYSMKWREWQSSPGAWAANPTHWMPLPAPPPILTEGA